MYRLKDIPLSPTEFGKLMLKLFRGTGRTLSRKDLIRAVESEHINQGGMPTRGDGAGVFKKAMTFEFVKAAGVENPATGWYRFPYVADVEYPQNYSVAKQRLFDHQRGICMGCGRKFGPDEMQLDHIVPESRGGPDCFHNWQLLCGSCNQRKGNKPHVVFMVEILGSKP